MASCAARARLALCTLACKLGSPLILPALLPSQPGQLKLGDWLADTDTVAMLKSGVLRSLTFKANEFGENISKEDAINNSAAWEAVEEGEDVPELPSADWNDEILGAEPSSPAGSSASHAATPTTDNGKGGTNGKGKGRGGRGGRGRGLA